MMQRNETNFFRAITTGNISTASPLLVTIGPTEGNVYGIEMEDLIVDMD